MLAKILPKAFLHAEKFCLRQNGILTPNQRNKQPLQPFSLRWNQLAKIIYNRNGIDPAKISEPYSLFAVMLLVAEILFAIWFFKAQSSTERTIAGSLIALIFISLMLFVLRLNRPPYKKNLHNKKAKNQKFKYWSTIKRYLWQLTERFKPILKHLWLRTASCLDCRNILT